MTGEEGIGRSRMGLCGSEQVLFDEESTNREWEHLFLRLHANGEEPDFRFIGIYGLQDGHPDVPSEEVTVLQQGEITTEDRQHINRGNMDIQMKITIYIVASIWLRPNGSRPGK